MTEEKELELLLRLLLIFITLCIILALLPIYDCGMYTIEYCNLFGFRYN